MKQAPEQYRLKKHPFLGSDSSYGNNGMFIIPHPRISDYFINCMISDGEGWEHVSVSISSTKRKVDRCPTWEEMCFVKNCFWNENETVVEYHPAEEDYVNMHPFVLHLWKPIGIELPKPDPEMVGIKNKTRNETTKF